MKRLVALAACAAFLGACGSDSPGSAPTAPSSPVAATPAPTPPPTPTPAPSAPTFVSATLRVLGFTRGGIRYSFVPTVFRRGDSIDLDCTPRDADGRAVPASSHPSFAEWYTSSTPGGPIVDRDYTLGGDGTYTPVLFIRQICPAGYITVQCRVGASSVYSNTLNLPTSGN